MKKFISVFLSVAIAIFLCACGSQKNHIDASNFGFKNNFGMYKLLYIKAFNFNDKQNAYVSTESAYDLINWENNHFTNIRYSVNDDCLYDENESVDLGEYNGRILNFSIVDNNLLTVDYGYDQGSEFKIIERNVESGIPLLKTDLFVAGYNSHLPDGERWYMPTGFIDWTRSPEVHYSDNKKTCDIRYYIDPQYFN